MDAAVCLPVKSSTLHTRSRLYCSPWNARSESVNPFRAHLPWRAYHLSAASRGPLVRLLYELAARVCLRNSGNIHSPAETEHTPRIPIPPERGLAGSHVKVCYSDAEWGCTREPTGESRQMSLWERMFSAGPVLRKLSLPIQPAAHEAERKWTPGEDTLLRRTLKCYRKKGALIAKRFPGRAAEQCEKRWNNALQPH